MCRTGSSRLNRSNGAAPLNKRGAMFRTMSTVSSSSCRLAKALALSCTLCTRSFAFVYSTTSSASGGAGRSRVVGHTRHVSSAGVKVVQSTGCGATMIYASSDTLQQQHGRRSRRIQHNRRDKRHHRRVFTLSASPSAELNVSDESVGTEEFDALSMKNRRVSTADDDEEITAQGDEDVDDLEDDGDDEDEDYEDDDQQSGSMGELKLIDFLDGRSRGQMLDVEKILAETSYLDEENVPEGFRTGFVSIVGSPNVGKSTLMNSMIGDKLSIVTPKAGTTRHRISGIMTGEDFQLIYQDTPGVLNPMYMLHEGMMTFVQEAMGDADCILFMTDIFENEFPSAQIFESMKETGKPVVVAINKVDLLPSDGEQGDGDPRPGKLSAARQKEVGSLKEIVAVWEERLPGAQVLPISALEGINTEKLAESLKEHIPEGIPLFGDDVMSDKPQRFFAAEIIREQIFACFSQEIPYSCEVLMDNFKERKSETVLDATIVVSQESQKGMVIGKKGAKIKEVGIKARIALEEYLQTRVNLRLNVKVDKNWRKNKDSLKTYGYIQ